MTTKIELITKLQTKTSIIGIVGLGYVGLPLGLLYAEVGFKVLGLDIDQDKIETLNQGNSYIAHIPPHKIQTAIQANFHATTDFSSASEADALILCVPTPLNKWREPDLSYIVNTLDALLPYLRAGQVISLESTTYPGNTEEVLKPKLEERGFTLGEDFFLVYSPEREDPANPNYSTAQIPKVCGGIEPNSLAVGTALYEQVVREVVPVSSTRAAEMTKLLENIHRAVNIGLVNEMKIVADKMGIDIYEVIRAAATKPFGFVPYYPGPGLGGHCIPIDPFYLTWKAREYGIHTRFIELAGEVNSNMPRWVIGKTMNALNTHGKALKGSKILVMGIAYKKNVDDMRESPAIVILERLIEKGAQVEYHDPYVPVYPTALRNHKDLHLKSITLTPQKIAVYDCVLITTAHKNIDYDLLQQHASLIIDTRGVYQQPAEHIVKA